MQRVLFIQYASLSHINAGVKIAEILRESGYEIHYLIHEKSFKYVAARGFHAIKATMLPFREKYNKALLKEMKLYQPYLERIRTARRQTFIQQRKAELLKAIDQVSPAVIIADTFAGLDFILLYNTLKNNRIKFFYLEILLSATEIQGVPYLTGKAFPHQRAKIFFEHLHRKYTRALKRIMNKVGYFGFDNYSTLKKIARENKLHPEYSINRNNYLDPVFNNVDSIIVVPEELEFQPDPDHLHRHVLGFLRNEDDEQVTITDTRLLDILASGKKIIYVSFGTIFVHRKITTIVAFLKKLQAALAAWPQAIAVFSSGGASYPENELHELTSIHAFSFLPQTKLLQHCDLFITHGGINSIKESLYQGIPMLVYPLAMDQIGNARKIYCKGLGLMGDIEKDTPAQLQQKIGRLLSDHAYARQVKAFAEKLPVYDLEKKLLTIIENNGTVK